MRLNWLLLTVGISACGEKEDSPEKETENNLEEDSGCDDCDEPETEPDPIDADNDGVFSDEDCDDNDPLVGAPLLEELHISIDKDHDGTYEEDKLIVWQKQTHKFYAYSQLYPTSSSHEEWFYDEHQNLLSYEQDADGDGVAELIETHTYDADHNPLSRERRYNGMLIATEYWTYDANGNLIRHEEDGDADGFTDLLEIYVYASNGKQISYEKLWYGALAFAEYHSYDSSGTLLSHKQDTNGDGNFEHSEAWSYDSSGNFLSYELLQDGSLIDLKTISYDENGIPLFLERTGEYNYQAPYDSQSSMFSYFEELDFDNDGFLDDCTYTHHQNGDHASIICNTYTAPENYIQSETWTYHPNGKVETHDDVTVWYYQSSISHREHDMRTYDEYGQLRRNSIQGSSSSHNYTYDENGNLTEDIYSMASTYLITSYEYDENENLIEKVQWMEASEGEGEFWTYDPNNRMRIYDEYGIYYYWEAYDYDHLDQRTIVASFNQLHGDISYQRSDVCE